MALGIIVTGLNAGVRSLLTTEIQPVKKSNQRGESGQRLHMARGLLFLLSGSYGLLKVINYLSIS